MQSRGSRSRRQRITLVAVTALWLSACGGGGGGGGTAQDVSAAPAGGQPSTTANAAGPSASGAPLASASPAPLPPAAPTPSMPGQPAPPSASSVPPAPPTSAAPPAAAAAPVAAPPVAAAPVSAPSSRPDILGSDGPDILSSPVHPTVMAGGKGDDIYNVTDPADVVIELPDEGIDEIRTTVGYTLPANVENMSVSSATLNGGGNALVGNGLNNRIVGPAFTKADIYGMDGDDILEAGVRAGAYLDGGAGNDTLINNIGESRGGPGADLFVVKPRGAMTSPDVPMTVLDFTPDDGDRIDGSFLGGGEPAALFASGNLIFDAAGHRLIYTRDPARFQVQPTAVEQIILLPGISTFDPAWIIRR